MSFLCTEDFVMKKCFLFMKTYSKTTFSRVTDVFHESIMYYQSHFLGVEVGRTTTMEIFQQDLCHKQHFLLP